jgi:hypothetical protein
MQINRRNQFITIRTEGAILPADLLKKIADNDKSIEGLTPEAYHLEAGEKLNEAISSAWNRLLGAWSTFKAAREKLPPTDAGTTITRERWLLPLFNHLGYGRLQLSKGITVNNEPYSVSHLWQKTPIHLIGCNVELDKRTPRQAGAARMSPHGLIQQLLNRSDDHLWAFLSNGLTLRILRDNIALTRQAYVEFDLEAMMDNEVYSDFILLFLLCHQSRVEAERPEECWLERWSKLAQDQGIRALNQLRAGVEEAIKCFGSGFISHPANTILKENLKSGAFSKEDYYRELLRLIYRLIFLFVAEDRELFFTKDFSPKVKDLYTRYYSTGRLRRLATRRKGTQHGDQWQGLKLVFVMLDKDEGCPELGLPALGSFLWSKDATRHLDSCELANADLLAAIKALTVTTDSKARRPVDYKNLGSEELGSIYESLLELHPQINSESGSFDLGTVGGNERKTTGSYYTPSSLVQCLLDSALDPVLDEAVKKDNPEKAILDLKICDPACGSGHFLIAASHRLAKRLAAVRTGDDEPSPEAILDARRDVIGHCLYGVDLNPLAVELCKVSLWMEALEPGKPLSFLEHKIQCGNSLLGATPALLEKGIPDDAFKPIEGDDKTFCSEYRKANKIERQNTGLSLFAPGGMPWEQLGNHAAAMMNLDDISDDTINAIHTKEERYARALQSGSYFTTRFWADTWCAAFVWKKKKTNELPFPITEDIFRKIEKSPFDVPTWMKDEIIRLKDQYNFFHWHIAFPTVFRIPPKGKQPENEQTGRNGGFDVVLGNPPYGAEITEKEKETIAYEFPHAHQTSNSAADFLELGQNIISIEGFVGLVIPKSFTYSYSWQNMREYLIPVLTTVIDVSKAWRDVLLEQVLVSFALHKAKPIQNQSIKLGRYSDSNIRWNSTNNLLMNSLGIIPTGLSPDDFKTLETMLKIAPYSLSHYCSTKRGSGIQRLLSWEGEMPVLGGKDIGDFCIDKPSKFITKNVIDSKSVQTIIPPHAIFQNIVAHITRPSDHIRLIGAVTKNPTACLDTVNIIKIDDSVLTPWSIAGLLMSDLINWYVYYCIYNRAVRTMHFDGYFLSKIRVPESELLANLHDCGTKIDIDPKCESSWRDLNKTVFDIYRIERQLGDMISERHKPRWL